MADGRLQLVRQGGEDFVELLVALRLAALRAAAAPQETHLELRLEDFVNFRLLLESWRGRKEREEEGCKHLQSFNTPAA